MSGSVALHLYRLTRFNRASVPAVLFTALVLACSASASGQTAAGPNPQPFAESASGSLPDAPLPQSADLDSQNEASAVTLRGTPLRILKDQGAIWTSPARLRSSDAAWLAVFALATTVAITSDHQAMSTVVSHDANFNHKNITASNIVTGGFIAAPVALFSLGQFRANPHAREAGILGGEAILDGVVVEQGVKLICWRERPNVDQSKGAFFQSSAGIDSSFPSSHSLLVWSAASVIAHEYPSRLIQFGAYGLATGVSLTRVLGQEHFPSDVLVGSGLGWLLGRYVYHRHHNISLE
jgi:hypothetical protein